MSDGDQGEWEAAYERFLSKLRRSTISAVILDYDETIYRENRGSDMPRADVGAVMTDILNHGVHIGISTGRGDSVVEPLRKTIPEELWSRVIISFYNGSAIGALDEDTCLQVSTEYAPVLEESEQVISQQLTKTGLGRVVRRRDQLRVYPRNNLSLANLFNCVHTTLKKDGLHDVKVLMSSRCIDVIPVALSKAELIDWFEETKNVRRDAILCIGDKGRWPGNDWELLTHPLSLSVDEVSFDPDSCWNLSPPGMRGPRSVLYYFSRVKYARGSLTLRSLGGAS